MSGTYSTRAAEAYPPGVTVLPPLGEILGPNLLHDAQRREDPWPALRSARTATFTSSGDWTQVRFRDDADGEATLVFKRKAWWGGSVDESDAMYQCRELEQGPVAGFDGPRKALWSVPFLASEGDIAFIFLSKAVDDSLIVNFRTDRMLVTGLLVGSYRWVGSVWWRYPPVAPGR